MGGLRAGVRVFASSVAGVMAPEVAAVKLAPAMRRLWPFTFLLALLALSGCAATLTAYAGPVGQENILTLVVSRDLGLIGEKCGAFPLGGRVYGCEFTRSLQMPDGTSVRLVTVVRYTDSLPSGLSFEVEVHELCHVVAALQAIPDPCHSGNHGVRAD